MREKSVVLKAVFIRHLIMLRRYSFNTLSGLITTYIVFMLLLTGARAVGGAGVMTGVASLESLVIGYCVWVFAMFGYQELAWGIVNEAQMGTLEKLYLSPVGFGWVSGFNQIAILVVQLVFTSVLLASIVLTTGVQLQFDSLSIVPLLLVTVSAAYGLGFAMGGLALIYKRVQAAFQILQFMLIGFLTMPAAWGKYLPLNLGNRMLTTVMVEGTRLWQFSSSELLTLLLVNLAYLAIGLVVFGKLERRARDRGLLGHY